MLGRGKSSWLVGVSVVGAAFMVGASGAGATATGTTHRAQSGSAVDITPILECSVAQHGMTRTVFGYHNPGPTTTVAVGPDNMFSPGPAARGQPTRFVSGTRVNVFQVRDPRPVVWTLGSRQVHAPGPVCEATPASSTLAGWGPIAGLVGVTLVLGGLLFWRTRRLRARAT